jgi:hypothetical protein
MPLSSHLLERHVRNVGSGLGVLQSQAAKIAVRIDLEQRVLVEFASLDHGIGTKLDVQRVRILEVRNLHGLNVRSKNALCTV